MTCTRLFAYFFHKRFEKGGFSGWINKVGNKVVEENVFTLDEEPVGPEVVSFLRGLADGSSRIIVDLCQNAGDMRRIPVKPVPSVADLGCDILFQREAVSGYRRYETRLIIVSWTVSRGFFSRNGLSKHV